MGVFMRNYFFIFVLIVVSLIPLIDLCHPGLPVTHDGQDHVARIANFYQNLAEGNIIPRWASNLNWGYGHPILMFLYPLPSYAASLFHFIGFSLIDSIKLVFGLAFILSGLTMYIWVRAFLGPTAGISAAAIYMFAPYRFVDLYVRGAIGEHVAFIFPPLIFFFLYALSKQYKPQYLIGGAFSVAGLLLSHNAISLMFIPLLAIYVLYLAIAKRKKTIFFIYAFFLVSLGFSLAAFFWVPAFFEGKYTLRDIVTGGGEYARHFSPLSGFFVGDWSYGGSGQFTVQVGVVHWIFIFLSIPILFILKKQKNNSWIFSLIILLYFISTLFLMTSNSKVIWEKVTVLQKFQFPWRFLSLSVFCAAVLGGIVTSVLRKNRWIFASITILLLLFTNKDFWHVNGFLQKNESFYKGVYKGTTDTGESAPVWSVRFMEKEPKSHLEIISGNGVVQEKERKVTHHMYEVVLDERSQMRENTLYFPGWDVYIDGQKVPIEFQNPAHRGLLTFFVDKGIHNIDIIFTDTKVRLLANSISMISFILVVIMLIVRGLLWQPSQLF